MCDNLHLKLILAIRVAIRVSKTGLLIEIKDRGMKALKHAIYLTSYSLPP